MSDVVFDACLSVGARATSRLLKRPTLISLKLLISMKVPEGIDPEHNDGRHYGTPARPVKTSP
ncbi:hypothetical protein CVE34_14265 [Pseudomonas syringae pv. actinidiae]|uniref:Uncharacterized protein n=2 Tax=Pseudomonas syringae group TaxID=136849 RepID=A0A261WI49_9PSED|nr:hypothetical protein B1R35_13190 [Pseudomonas syringae pv. actinidiae]AYL80813.1 hypothetical protein CN228_13345 [Pseudomonas syringae pv. actinidiae str. Shaanxi_M228]MBL3831369.1 hypothetical protein [Pseudomonas syringae pv. theae]OZI85632.1 hypothetical protein CFN58_16905 [Pseudomonas avellanae]AQX66475.1 hypothetical protein B1F85_22745 [Pseudomonas syringae pv. actinidiae]